MGLDSTGHLNAQAAVRRLRMDDVTFTFIPDGAMSLAPHVFIKTAPPTYWAQHPEWFCDPDINPAAVPKARQRLLDELPRCCFHRPELYNRSSNRHSNPAASLSPTCRQLSSDQGLNGLTANWITR
jgi:hypothetical protein